jgi:hypothetical protein
MLAVLPLVVSMPRVRTPAEKAGLLTDTRPIIETRTALLNLMAISSGAQDPDVSCVATFTL